MIPLIEWSKWAKLSDTLLWDTQACGKTTKITKGTIHIAFREWAALGRRPGTQREGLSPGLWHWVEWWVPFSNSIWFTLYTHFKMNYVFSWIKYLILFKKKHLMSLEYQPYSCSYWKKLWILTFTFHFKNKLSQTPHLSI